ncbi:DUF4253 domain-containing protein [Pseudonocardia sp. TRM90224]|uniref:DUF4253 domain-containing protein n=1 Tax=Pseudonocardia sp. TRM90224 TaxID=2812678 RepID=UPI001E423035|nr:DUF4253 domain-containing protein [Pseudonocardia sp. TRM90224]
MPLPAELASLLPDSSARTLSVPLPAGRLITPDVDLGAGAPAYWISDGPASAELWAQLRSEHVRSGLWPLLLDGMDDDPSRPWLDGEVTPRPVGEIDGQDAAAVLAAAWADWVEEDDADDPDEQYDFDDLAPFGPDWPGIAPPGVQMKDPDAVADWFVGQLDVGDARLGLVAAECGADSLTIAGWDGPVNHSATPPLSAVLRSWEDRFGVRVVRVGFASLLVSVAAPPMTTEHALRVAAEHFGFCPDNIQQGEQGNETLTAYAELLKGQNSWFFWWD